MHATPQGPKRQPGKATCSLNGLHDGLYATTLILPGEDRAEFDKIHDRIQARYQPQDDSQQSLIYQMAAVEWKMLRADLLEAGVLFEYGDGPASACIDAYDRIMRIQGRLHRISFKLYKELESIKAAREKDSRKTKGRQGSPNTSQTTSGPAEYGP